MIIFLKIASINENTLVNTFLFDKSIRFGFKLLVRFFKILRHQIFIELILFYKIRLLKGFLFILI